MASMELEGMDQLIKKIADMGKAGIMVENAALKKAGEVILEEAKNNVPERTGKLKNGLKVSGVKSKNGRKYVLVGIQKSDNSEIFYGKFFEFGTSKMKAKPFMAPAYESKKRAVTEIIKEEIRRGLGL